MSGGIRTGWGVLVIAASLGLSGCSKKVSALVAEHQADFARLDAMIASANAEVAKVPEHGIHAFPRCKPNPAYAFDGDKHNIDIVGARLLAGNPSPLTIALAMRAETTGMNRFAGPAATASHQAAVKALATIQSLVVIREHKGASSEHVTADVFVVSGTPAKIVCAFGFNGGEGSAGSMGQVVGKEIWKEKKTGKVVSERDLVEGKESGTSAAANAVRRLPTSFARNLGIALDVDSRAVAEKARAGEVRRLGDLPAYRITQVLEDRGATDTRYVYGPKLGLGLVATWRTDDVVIQSLDLDKDTYTAIGPEQAVAVTGTPDGGQIAAKLVAQPFATAKELATRLTGLGYRPSSPPSKDEPKLDGGLRRYTMKAKKGTTELTVDVVDLADAAHRRNAATFRVDGRQLVVVQGNSRVLGTAEEIATEIVGK